MIDPARPLLLSDGTLMTLVGASDTVVEATRTSNMDAVNAFVYPVLLFSRTSGKPLLDPGGPTLVNA